MTQKVIIFLGLANQYPKLGSSKHQQKMYYLKQEIQNIGKAGLWFFHEAVRQLTFLASLSVSHLALPLSVSMCIMHYILPF